MRAHTRPAQGAFLQSVLEARTAAAGEASALHEDHVAAPVAAGCGAAAGPSWLPQLWSVCLALGGDAPQQQPGVRVLAGCEVERVDSARGGGAQVHLTSGEAVEVDVVVVAAGVLPSVDWCAASRPRAWACRTDSAARKGARVLAARPRWRPLR